MVPPSGFRMSDADRERAVDRLRAAATEGRLTLDEFEQRVDGVLAAKTFGEIQPFLADLPSASGESPARDFVELRTTASNLRRQGRWAVPRRIYVSNKAATVKLDFTEAVISYPVVEVEVDGWAGTTKLVLPPGATVDVEGVELMASGLRVRKVPQSTHPMGTGPHFVVRGRDRIGTVVVRYERRFWRWRW